MSDPIQYGLDFTSKLPPQVQERIAAGMQQADENADPKWKHFWDACVMAAARKKPEITSDDVLEEFEKLVKQPHTHNLAAIGPAMKRARTMGILQHTDRVVRSERKEKNGNRHNVWISLVYGA